MNKERLEEIEDRFYKTGYEINTASPEPQQIRADLHHLIYTVNEQAERVEELEQQNKRYRELIKKMKRMVYDPDVDCGMICTEIIEMEESE